MTVESDADRAVFVAPGDFGTTATWTHDGTSTTVEGIFDHPAAIVSGVSDVDQVTRQASFLCAEADLPAGAGQGDTVAIGVASYAVRAFLPDGTGMVRAELAIL